ncbi:MAG TPA: sigma-70 family RNA polymerase sigma factor [Planctomycetaceae bacterium]|nr:sigma-70 family RNA polymerase sigma factor [Planctomycetaceae bacterium]
MTAEDHSPLDPAIVAALYVEHAEELRRFLIGVLRDHQLASDVLQTSFVKLAEKGHATREGSRKAWLFRVAYHEAMAIRRREKVGDKVQERMAWVGEHTSAAADQPLLRREAVAAVREALQQLPPEQLQVVRMRIYEEKKFVEIADELNIPLGTALGRMRSGLQKLRTSLENKNEESP